MSLYSFIVGAANFIAFIFPLTYTITVENLSPRLGTCQSPVWIGIQSRGAFDIYDLNEPAAPFLESIAEDGATALISRAFLASPAPEADGTAGSANFCSGEKVSFRFRLRARRGTTFYLSYASMVLPSNDAFVANGNPLEHKFIDPNGRLVLKPFVVKGSEVLDAGTEVNDEIPENTAMLGQMEPNTGYDEFGVVSRHPGFMQRGNILSAPDHVNADFTRRGFNMIRVSATVSFWGKILKY